MWGHLSHGVDVAGYQVSEGACGRLPGFSVPGQRIALKQSIRDSIFPGMGNWDEQRGNAYKLNNPPVQRVKVLM